MASAETLASGSDLLRHIWAENERSAMHNSILRYKKNKKFFSGGEGGRGGTRSTVCVLHELATATLCLTSRERRVSLSAPRRMS